MVGRKLLGLFAIAGIALLGTASCKKTPIACFTTDINQDSIHVHQAVTFNATCSTFADSYNWQFYNNQDSIAFTPVVVKTFKDTGSVQVYLLVTSGNEYAGLTQYINVKP